MFQYIEIAIVRLLKTYVALVTQIWPNTMLESLHLQVVHQALYKAPGADLIPSMFKLIPLKDQEKASMRG